MDHYRVTSTAGVRMWHADNKNHAVEQHNLDFLDEEIIEVVREGACNCWDEVWTGVRGLLDYCRLTVRCDQ